MKRIHLVKDRNPNRRWIGLNDDGQTWNVYCSPKSSHIQFTKDKNNVTCKNCLKQLGEEEKK